MRQGAIPRYTLHPREIPPYIVQRKHEGIADPKILENLIPKETSAMTESV